MNIIWHFIWTYVLFRRQKWVKKALIFSIVPDLPWIISNIVSYVIYGFTPKAFEVAWDNPIVWQFQYFFNSFVIILSFYIILKLFKLNRYIPYIYGWAFHAIVDSLTHVSDAYPLFWPFSLKVFPSFISYWERSHYSLEFSIFNLVLFSIFGFFMLFRKYEKIKDLSFEFYFYVISFVFILLNSLVVIFIFNAHHIIRYISTIIPLFIFMLLIVKIIREKHLRKWKIQA